MDDYLMREMIIEEAKRVLELNGLEELDDIRYSFSYSQGDGIAFYGGVTVPIFNSNHSFFENVILQDVLYLDELRYYALKYNVIDEDTLNDLVAVFKITKDRNFSHYDHYNTMHLRFDNMDFEDIHYLISNVLDHLSERDDWQLGVNEIFGEDPEYVEEICREINDIINYYVNNEDKDYEIVRRNAIYDELRNHYLNLNDNIDYEDLQHYTLEGLKTVSKNLERNIYRMIEKLEKEQKIFYFLEEINELLCSFNQFEEALKNLDSEERKMYRNILGEDFSYLLEAKHKLKNQYEEIEKHVEGKNNKDENNSYYVMFLTDDEDYFPTGEWWLIEPEELVNQSFIGAYIYAREVFNHEEFEPAYVYKGKASSPIDTIKEFKYTEKAVIGIERSEVPKVLNVEKESGWL